MFHVEEDDCVYTVYTLTEPIQDLAETGENLEKNKFQVFWEMVMSIVFTVLDIFGIEHTFGSHHQVEKVLSVKQHYVWHSFRRLAFCCS